MGGPDAVLQTLFYSSQLNSREGSEISIRSVKDHFGYQSEIQSLETKTVADLDQLEELPLSSNGGGAGSSGIDIVLNELGLSLRWQRKTLPWWRISLRLLSEERVVFMKLISSKDMQFQQWSTYANSYV
ncbi:hypothetical protein LWI29_014821 [Acer saccharum]|uniref:Uncharacterized protein n=1 Tax=Acer saccharum TaxID=4024 RepID=A0AA39T241_ACESA|nr:hypothetical protein LWI29_014821 [Acer saccharum]